MGDWTAAEDHVHVHGPTTAVAHVTKGTHANRVWNHVLNHVLMYMACTELALPLTGLGERLPPSPES